jgi:hypothetical protein
LVSQDSTGSTLESKWLMLRVRNSIFRWYSTYCISVLTTICTLECLNYEGIKKLHREKMA